MTASLLCLLSLLSLSWPFLMGSGDEYRIQRGYGDYDSGESRSIEHLFHTAVDTFPLDPWKVIQVPYPNHNYIYDCYYNSRLHSWTLFITEDKYTNPPNPGVLGYVYSHVHGFLSTYHVGEDRTQLTKCADPPASGYRHVHIAISNTDNWSQPMPFPDPGIANIIDQLSCLTDNVLFSGVVNNHGIGFLPESNVWQVPPPGFQEVIRGPVDFVVAPRSSFSDTDIEDSCGVRKLSILSISRQNPCSAEYDAVSYYTAPRDVFDWSNELPDCVAAPVPNEYFYLYHGNLSSEGSFWKADNFDIYYHASNSSADSPGEQGIDNIWTAPYNSQVDWLYSQNNPEIRCRGAWDTILKKVWTSSDQSACENSEACFPDGKYLIDVTATSHTGNTDSISLPVDNVTLPDPTPVGIIVDNFVPHVEEIIFYTTYPDGEFHLLYSCTWNSISETNRTPTESVIGYLPYGMDTFSSGYLGMAVRFSEPMDPEELPSVWVEGKWADDNSGHWVCYKTLRYEDPGYIGSLSINVGEAQQVPGTGQGLDLAGNQLDPDPSTIHPPLTQYYNSRSMLSSVESPYLYSWGSPPEYSVSSPMRKLGA